MSRAVASLSRAWRRLVAWLRRAWRRLLGAALLPGRGDSRDAPALLSHSIPLTRFTRADYLWAAATAVTSAVLFATVLSSHAALGDAPESIAGIKSLGILHDPGYPTYVLTAHLFTLLEPIGSEALRVNLFSLICASLSVGGVALLSRRFGVPQWAGTVGALTLAASGGFWYYAVFAKHDVFSGLLFLLTLHLAIGWLARPTTRRLVALAVVIAWGVGSSWPLEVLVLPAVGFVLLAGRRELRLPSLAAATGTGLAVLVAIGGFVMVRASANPPVNWGGATNVSRLIALVKRSDFTTPGNKPQTAPSSAETAPQKGTGTTSGGGLVGGAIPSAAATNHVSGYVDVLSRELGVLGLLLGIAGLIVSLTRRRNPASFPVLIAFLGNLVGATAVIGFGSGGWGLNADLMTEGFILGCYLILACWIGLGSAELVGAIGRIRIGHVTGAPAGEAVDQGEGPRRGGLRMRPVLATIGVLALGAALVVPLVSRNWSAVHRSTKPFADRYARTIFSELPPHAAVFILGAELSQPLIYQQVVDHVRPDVAVVALDGLSTDWYRAQASRKLGVEVPPLTANVFTGSAQILDAVARVRPVYVDARAAQQLKGAIGYSPVGLISRYVPGPAGPVPVASPAALGTAISAAVRQAGFPDPDWNVWPNNFVSTAEYSAAALQAAQAFYQYHDVARMRQALQEDLRILPGNPPAQQDLQLLGSGKG